MFKHKILRYIIVASSIVAFCVPLFSDYVGRKTLQRYDLRWYKALDEKDRIQTIVLRNAGNQPKENLVFELGLGANPSRVLSDVETSLSEGGPYESFLNAVERANAELFSHLTPPEKRKLSQALDKHSSTRSLNDLDIIFDDILRERLIAETGSRVLTNVPSNQPNHQNWHMNWKQKCATAKPSTDCPKVDSALGGWEQAKDLFRNAAMKNWYEQTGIKLEPDSDQLSFRERLVLTLPLGANQHRFLRFHYSHSPATIYPSFRSTTGEQTTQVNSLEDLFSPFLFLVISKHPISLVIISLLVMLVAYYGPILLPLRIVPIEKIFNFALESKDHEYWKHALERHRFFILQQFRGLRKRFNPQLTVDSEEVIDFVRQGLMEKYKSTALKFRNTKALNTSIRDELWHLVHTAI